MAHRTCQNVTMTFRNARVPEESLLAGGEGDLLVHRNFTWSAPIASIAAVAVARGAYEFALKWAKTYTGGGVRADHRRTRRSGTCSPRWPRRSRPARYLCWKAAHYMDRHAGRGAGDRRDEQDVLRRPLMQSVVFDCMRIVGVNALDRKFPMEKFFRESMVFPLYDAGNLAMQRRRAWGVMADPSFSPDTFVDGLPLPFTRSMEGYGTVLDADGR